MPSLSQKFYGEPEQETEDQKTERIKAQSSAKRYGVRYSAVKYFLSKKLALEFYNQIEKGASLVLKDGKIGKPKIVKSK